MALPVCAKEIGAKSNATRGKKKRTLINDSAAREGFVVGDTRKFELVIANRQLRVRIICGQPRSSVVGKSEFQTKPAGECIPNGGFVLRAPSGFCCRRVPKMEVFETLKFLAQILGRPY
jgi:hypothetical protein